MARFKILAVAVLLAAAVSVAQAPEKPTRIVKGDGFTVNIYGDTPKVDVRQTADGWLIEVRP